MRLRSLSLTLSFAGLLLILVSCQKEFNPGIDDKLSSKDPKTLSAAIKVWHGVRTQGVPPSKSGSALELDQSLSGPVKAFAGRYAIIQPTVISGDVQGYYVAVNGSTEYFKVDYSKPRDIAGRQHPMRSRSKPFSNASGAQRSGNVDSSIVVIIPANINVPDTFCITYWAYDSLGNVSNPVSNCIIVNTLGTDAQGGWMTGSWRFTAFWDGLSRDTIIYNRWTASEQYYCFYDSLTGTSYFSSNPTSTPPVAADSMLFRKANLTFGVNGGMLYEIDYMEKYLDQSKSGCTQISYLTDQEQEQLSGAWMFNSQTNKVVIIFEFDDMGLPIVEAWEYDVIKVSNTNFIMVDNLDPAFPYFMRLEK